MLKLIRDLPTNQSTIGKIFHDDSFLCDTLEDVVRSPGVKIQDETAIPVGKYKIVLQYWPKYGRHMPLLLDVPNFTGIFIHTGNNKENTKGCILVGIRDAKTPDWIHDSRAVFYQKVMPRIETLLTLGPLDIEITNAFPVPQLEAA